ncbi:MAG: Imm49 family immunity protein [Mucilaginibacter sp.]|uniref:Imm49 family immunity protein n=1 Tax=Mucilaginibacter sp. TaxID=1882438 RepID=UPI003264476A
MPNKKENLLQAYQNRLNDEELVYKKIQEPSNKQIFIPLLHGTNQILGLYDLFIENDICKAKQHFYLCARIDEYMINNFDSRILDAGINHLSYALLSDCIPLMKRYAKLSHSQYKWMIENGHSTPLYILQQMMLDNWDQVAWGIDIMDKKTIKRHKLLIADRDFYEGMLNKDKNQIQDSINKILKAHKTRNKHYQLINEFISHPALGYIKLAWLKNIEINIDHPLIPKELLPYKPLDRYEETYSFLNDSV